MVFRATASILLAASQCKAVLSEASCATDASALLQRSWPSRATAGDDWRAQATQWVDALNARVRSWNTSNSKYDNSLHIEAKGSGALPAVSLSVDFDRTLADAYDCVDYHDVVVAVKAVVDMATPDMTGSAVTTGAAEPGFTYQNSETIDYRYLDGLRSQAWQGCEQTKGLVVPQAGQRLEVLKTMGPVEVVSYGPSGWERLNLPAKAYALFFNDAVSDWRGFQDKVHGSVHDKGKFLNDKYSDLRCHVHFDDAAIHIGQVNSHGGIGVNVDGSQGIADADILAAMGALYLRGCIDDTAMTQYKGEFDQASNANIWNRDQNGYSTWLLEQQYDFSSSSNLEQQYDFSNSSSKSFQGFVSPKYVAYFDSAPVACTGDETSFPPNITWTLPSDDGHQINSPLDFHRNSDDNHESCLDTFCNGSACGSGKISIGAVHSIPFYNPGKMIYWLRSSLSFYKVEDLSKPIDLSSPTYTMEDVTVGQESWSGLFSSGDNWWLHSPSCFWENARAPNRGWPAIYCWTTTKDVCVSFQVQNPKTGVRANVLSFQVHDANYPYGCPTSSDATATDLAEEHPQS